MSPDDEKVPVLAAAVSVYGAGDREPLHEHEEEGQLKWPATIALVRTPVGIFVVPPRYAVWIPAGQRHGGIYPHAVREASLFIEQSECGALPSHCCAVPINAALEGAIMARVSRSRRPPPDWFEQDRAVIATVRAELVDAGFRPLPIELPSASPVQSVIEALLREPAQDLPVESWATRLGMSASTFSRTFHQATGMSFGNWRSRARLLLALQRLAAGIEVSQVAQELDYRPSAFVQMFRKILGTTPGRYFGSLGSP